MLIDYNFTLEILLSDLKVRLDQWLNIQVFELSFLEDLLQSHYAQRFYYAIDIEFYALMFVEKNINCLERKKKESVI